MNLLTKRSALTGLFVLAGFASAGAFAQEPTDTSAPSITVRYADLNLTEPVAVEVLYRRVQMAAQEVCNHGQSRELARQVAADKCVHNAMNNAIQKLDVPELNALYRVKSNRKDG